MSKALEIRLEKGPLSRERLGVIADLYGRADPKYASVDFCEHQFNRNPAGGSFHAFAQDGDRVVGVHNLIPIEATAGGASIPSAKAEALFFLEEYRGATVPHGDATAPLSLANSVRLYKFGMEHGIRVIHMMGEAGQFFRYTGSRVLTLPDTCSYFILDPPAGTEPRALATRGLALAQRAAELASGATTAFAPPAVTIDGRGAEPRVLAPFTREPDPADQRWTLRLDVANITWFAGTGLLELSTCGAASALVRRRNGPGDVEIVAWNGGGAGALVDLALVRHIIGRARASGASRVAAWESTLEPGSSPALALRALGFFRMKRDRTFYVKANDRFFIEPANVRFTPFFWVTF